ncbi:MAG: thioesterase [Gammaproteobacteria bacterium]|nr:MAG: thioesterase [Gammaproteobacteria bacterium]PIE37882.1 MAG: thioesterase [Gammaproteobacteria bacterium]
MATRWVDNDSYGHLNNAVYYSVFENTLMRWLEVEQGLDTAGGEVRCYTVESGCRFLEAVRYPDDIVCTLRVARIGNSSVRYELAIFTEGAEEPAAAGHVVDVFVDSQSERPVSIPAPFVAAFERIHVGGRS